MGFTSSYKKRQQSTQRKILIAMIEARLHAIRARELAISAREAADECAEWSRRAQEILSTSGEPYGRPGPLPALARMGRTDAQDPLAVSVRWLRFVSDLDTDEYRRSFRDN